MPRKSYSINIITKELNINWKRLQEDGGDYFYFENVGRKMFERLCDDLDAWDGKSPRPPDVKFRKDVDACYMEFSYVNGGDFTLMLCDDDSPEWIRISNIDEELPPPRFGKPEPSLVLENERLMRETRKRTLEKEIRASLNRIPKGFTRTRRENLILSAKCLIDYWEKLDFDHDYTGELVGDVLNCNAEGLDLCFVIRIVRGKQSWAIA